MYNFEENVRYFGKLRRRREFLKDLKSTNIECRKWEKWFGKCSNSNLLVPFLDNKDKLSSCWLFLEVENEKIFCGLTKKSTDMAGRKYPFLIYTVLDQKDRLSKDVLFQVLYDMACRNNKFDDIVTGGDITEVQYSYFISSDGCSIINHNDKRMIEHMTNNAFFHALNEQIHPMSFWLNVQSLKYIEHNNALTCSLYNKIYG